jgi:pimeloyl-ACP methyl ester carboxylesterase
VTEPSLTPYRHLLTVEIYVPLRRRAEERENIVRWTRFEHGGHFAAMEQPTALVSDVRAFFAQLRADG